MTFCNQCQLVHGEGHRFCQRCGQLLKRLPSHATRPCGRCGADTFPGQKFCTDCGLPLRVVSPAADEFSPQERRAPVSYPRGAPAYPTRRRRRPWLTISLLTILVAGGVVGGYYGLRFFLDKRGGTTAIKQPTAKDTLEHDVKGLIDKVSTAHKKKDIHKFISCYDPNYPKLGSLENSVLEFWKNYDIKEATYNISELKRTGERQAAAVVKWTFQVFDHSKNDHDQLRPAYRITLEKGPDGWRIRDSQDVEDKEKVERKGRQ